MVKKTKKTARSKSSLDKIRNSVSDAAASFVEDIDIAKDKAVREIREGFEVVSKKAKKAGKAAAEATEGVKDSISDAQPVELIRELVDDVENVAEGIIQGISAKFNQLREAAVTETPVKKKAAIKKATVKKATVKKATTRKSPAKKK